MSLRIVLYYINNCEQSPLEICQMEMDQEEEETEEYFILYICIYIYGRSLTVALMVYVRVFITAETMLMIFKHPSHRRVELELYEEH